MYLFVSQFTILESGKTIRNNLNDLKKAESFWEHIPSAVRLTKKLQF